MAALSSRVRFSTSLAQAWTGQPCRSDWDILGHFETFHSCDPPRCRDSPTDAVRRGGGGGAVADQRTRSERDRGRGGCHKIGHMSPLPRHASGGWHPGTRQARTAGRGGAASHLERSVAESKHSQDGVCSLPTAAARSCPASPGASCAPMPRTVLPGGAPPIRPRGPGPVREVDRVLQRDCLSRPSPPAPGRPHGSVWGVVSEVHPYDDAVESCEFRHWPRCSARQGPVLPTSCR